MAVLSKEDLLQRLQARLGDDTSDEALQLLEDVTDTYTDFETKKTDGESDEWKTKYDELDQTWRQRYKERFLNTQAKDEDLLGKTKDEPKDNEEEKTYDDLFTESEG